MWSVLLSVCLCSAALGLLKAQLVRLQKERDAQRRHEESLTKDIVTAELARNPYIVARFIIQCIVCSYIA